MSGDDILVTGGLSERFGDFSAVSDVSLRIQRGAIHALIGPNGAGKTTCFNMLTKFIAPSSGRITFSGRDPAGRCRAARSRALIPYFGGVSTPDRARERPYRPATQAR